jgi:hypothetical protein
MSDKLKYSLTSRSFKFSPDLTSSEKLEFDKLIECSNKLKKVKDKETLNQVVNHLFKYKKF